jgi:hypothetical protein
MLMKLNDVKFVWLNYDANVLRLIYGLITKYGLILMRM